MSELDQYPELTCLVALNELSHLNQLVRERLRKEQSEHIADYRGLCKPLGHEPSLDGEIAYLRLREAEEQRLLRQSRRNIFAIGFSTFERFLDMRLRPVMPPNNPINRSGKRKPLYFSDFIDFLKECGKENGGYFASPLFHDDSEQCDLYRIARNKITHQAGYVDPETEDEEERKLLDRLGSKLFGVMLCVSDYLPGMEEIHIEESNLGEVLSFFERFALRIDGEMRSLEQSTC